MLKPTLMILSLFAQLACGESQLSGSERAARSGTPRAAQGPAQRPEPGASPGAVRPESRPARQPESRPAGRRLPDAKAYGALLSKVVAHGRVDYALLASERATLDAYLASLAGARPGAASKTEQLAFWINAYNAATLASVLDRVIGKGKDGADLASVRAVSGFFDADAARVAGSTMSLNDIEGRARKLGDPRVHFAVNCASNSCPVLLGRAWSAATLDEDLRAATAAYFASAYGMQVKGKRVYVSSILNWYSGDFGGHDAVEDFVRPYVPNESRRALGFGLSYLKYDWALNKR